MSARRFTLAACLAACLASSHHAARPVRAPIGALRFRGGEKPAPARRGALGAAAHKLCTSPSLIAAAGDGPFPVLARHVRGVVFGGMDGILTTFALLAAVAGSGTASTTMTLVIGISTVLADALSMAAGEYLSAKAEEEMGGGSSDPGDPGPIEKGVAMFLAFTLFGSMPLLGYGLAEFVAHDAASPFLLSIVITAGTLFALGAVKSSFGAGVWYKAGAEVTTIGGAAACVAYYTAQLVEKRFRDD